MKTLIISTPRTGSIFASEMAYHYHVYRGRNDARYLGEFLNPYHYDLYIETRPDGTRKNWQEPGPGRSMSYPIILNGDIAYIEGKYPGTQEDETKRRLGILYDMNKRRADFILHYHVDRASDVPAVINIGWDNVFWLLRRDRRAQILSYALAYHTKIFRYTKDTLPNVLDEAVPIHWVACKNLMRRICEFDSAFLATDRGFRIFYEDDIKGNSASILKRRMFGDDYPVLGNPSVPTPTDKMGVRFLESDLFHLDRYLDEFDLLPKEEEDD